MLRRASRLALIILLLNGFSMVPARAETARRVVVVTVDGTDVHDWSASGRFASFGAIGLLSTRTEAPSDDPSVLRASAYASLGAGSAAGIEPAAWPRPASGAAVLGLLGEELSRRRLLAAAIGDASGNDRSDVPAPFAVMRRNGTAATGPGDRATAPSATAKVWRPDANAPGGRRTDGAAVRAALRETLTWASLVVVDLGDAARADRTHRSDAEAREPWVHRALTDAARFVEDARAMLDPADTLIVASLVPPLDKVGRGINLAAVAFAESSSSLPTSGTTRNGVVAINDLAPTVLRFLGVEPPTAMEGRPIQFRPAASSVRFAVESDEEYTLALESRRPLARTWLIAAAILSVAALLTIAAGRGRSTRPGRLPRRWRDVLGIGLLAVAAAPAAFLLVPPFAGGSVVAVGWTSLGVAIGAAFIARAATASHASALGVIALADAAVYAGDLLTGSSFADRSALGLDVAGGTGLRGIGEGTLGVLLAAPLIAAAAWIDRARRERRVVALAALAFAGLAFVAAAPAWGARLGAPFMLVPAFGLFVVLARGHRIDRRSVTGIAIATVLLSASVVALDALSDEASATDVGRRVAGTLSSGLDVTRTLSSALEFNATTVWLPAALVVAASMILLSVRRRDLIERATWGRPAARAAISGAAMGAAMAMASNARGIVSVAAASPIVAAGFFGSILDPDQNE